MFTFKHELAGGAWCKEPLGFWGLNLHLFIMGWEKMELATPWFLSEGRWSYIFLDDAIRWWFQRFFIFQPAKNWGTWSNLTEGHMFHLGWRPPNTIPWRIEAENSSVELFLSWLPVQPEPPTKADEDGIGGSRSPGGGGASSEFV